MSKRILKSNFKKSHKFKGGENLCDTYSKKQEDYINICNHEAQKINKIRVNQIITFFDTVVKCELKPLMLKFYPRVIRIAYHNLASVLVMGSQLNQEE